MCDDNKDVTRNILTIYDLKNKFIAFSSKFEAILDVVAEWGSLFIVTSAHKVCAGALTE